MTSITLLDVIERTNQAQALPTEHHATLIYGSPKSGKTTLAATIARSTHIKRIFWFDPDNGLSTVQTMVRTGQLTKEQAAKIIPIKLPDTKESPDAINTLLKALCTKKAVNICQVDGLIDSVEGKAKGWPFIEFHYAAMSSTDMIVIDTISQVGISAMSLATLGKPTEYKLQLDDYGSSGKWLADLMSTIQAAKYCHFIAIAHDLDVAAEGQTSKLVPMCGTKNFSMGAGKYFGTLIYTSMKAKRHTAISTTSSSLNASAGSRIGIKLDGQTDLCLGTAYDAAGVFSTPSPISQPVATVGQVEEKPKLSALERLKAKTQ